MDGVRSDAHQDGHDGDDLLSTSCMGQISLRSSAVGYFLPPVRRRGAESIHVPPRLSRFSNSQDVRSMHGHSSRETALVSVCLGWEVARICLLSPP